MGGFAEDALLAGTVTREHADVDLLLPRHEEALRLGQIRELGFTEVETWGEAEPGVPFYLFAQNGELKLELGIADEIGGRILCRVHGVTFDIGGEPAPAGYQVVLPDDTFDRPPVALDGIAVRPVSPLALLQLRAGIASQGTFGELSERQRESGRALRERFFPGRSEAELEPAIEPLAL